MHQAGLVHAFLRWNGTEVVRSREQWGDSVSEMRARSLPWKTKWNKTTLLYILRLQRWRYHRVMASKCFSGKGKTPLRCAACKMESGDECLQLQSQECSRCLRDIPIQGPPLGFSPILLRQAIEGSKKKQKQGSLIWEGRWVCYECQYPKCTRCFKRSDFAGPSLTGSGQYRDFFSNISWHQKRFFQLII